MKTITLVLTLLLSVPLAAQDASKTSGKEAPVVSELDTLKLDKLQLRAEATSLRIALLQAEMQRLQAEFAEATSALKKEGFQLVRTEDGSWRYTPLPPPKPE